MIKYNAQLIECQFENISFINIWNTFVLKSDSAEKIYQSPSYFKFLNDTCTKKKDHFLLLITNLEDGKIIALVPFRLIPQKFNYSFGAKLKFSINILTISLLGSNVLFNFESELFELIISNLLKYFPDYSGISLPALPHDSRLNKYISASNGIQNEYITHVLDDWRPCHTIPLPKTFEDYLKQFSTKKRFNLKRQVRLLREYGENTLELIRITNSNQIQFYYTACKELAGSNKSTHFLPPNKLISLASNNLLHSYILFLKNEPIAVVSATRLDDVLHIHNIQYKKELSHFSIGVCILYMAVEDLIENCKYSLIDLGYSNPTHSLQSSNDIHLRGNMLILNKTFVNRLICFSHEMYSRQVLLAKRVIRKLQAVRAKLVAKRVQ